MTESVYWLGKCRECRYHSGLSFRYGLAWDCDLYKLPHIAKKLAEKCPSNTHYPHEDKLKPFYIGDEKIFNLEPIK